MTFPDPGREIIYTPEQEPAQAPPIEEPVEEPAELPEPAEPEKVPA